MARVRRIGLWRPEIQQQSTNSCQILSILLSKVYGALSLPLSSIFRPYVGDIFIKVIEGRFNGQSLPDGPLKAWNPTTKQQLLSNFWGSFWTKFMGPFVIPCRPFFGQMWVERSKAINWPLKAGTWQISENVKFINLDQICSPNADYLVLPDQFGLPFPVKKIPSSIKVKFGL